MASKQGSSIVAGTTEVVTAQTAVQLTKTKFEQACIGVWVCADPNNTGKAAVGDKNVNAKATLGTAKGLTLETKQPAVFIEIGDPSLLWIDTSVSKEFVTWVAVLA